MNPEALPISFKTSPLPCWQGVRLILIPCQEIVSATGVTCWNFSALIRVSSPGWQRIVGSFGNSFCASGSKWSECKCEMIASSISEITSIGEQGKSTSGFFDLHAMDDLEPLAAR